MSAGSSRWSGRSSPAKDVPAPTTPQRVDVEVDDVAAPGRRASGFVRDPGPRLLVALPARSLITAAALFPALLALQLGAGGGWAGGTAWGWTGLVVAVALASAATLGTYAPRPGAGRRLNLGCSPCSAVAPLSIVAATIVLGSAPHDVPTAILALGAAGFALRQRLMDPVACPTAS